MPSRIHRHNPYGHSHDNCDVGDDYENPSSLATEGLSCGVRGLAARPEDPRPGPMNVGFALVRILCWSSHPSRPGQQEIIILKNINHHQQHHLHSKTNTSTNTN
ncbi:hypothetical protein N7510_000137 [Penicillium lagena]|uniref:uncharacterized protein n=1 Tax=Penicillium lagena TaxID=94218 RepID=UPI00254114B3|nr:uncharacterized protein N7510_000137 [Penicillium lagena]KAJ5623828.1 hypothetical protein N7510_000137 [Penicillium lagena]